MRVNALAGLGSCKVGGDRVGLARLSAGRGGWKRVARRPGRRRLLDGRKGTGRGGRVGVPGVDVCRKATRSLHAPPRCAGILAAGGVRLRRGVLDGAKGGARRGREPMALAYGP